MQVRRSYDSCLVRSEYWVPGPELSDFEQPRSAAILVPTTLGKSSVHVLKAALCGYAMPGV
jgi:hypothetical protein